MKKEPVAKLWQNLEGALLGALRALSQNLGGDDWLKVICGAGHHLTTLIETVLPHEERSPAPPLKATVLDSLYPSRSLIVSGLGDWNKCLGIRGNQIRFAWSRSFSSSDEAANPMCRCAKLHISCHQTPFRWFCLKRGCFTCSDEFNTNQTNY